jgi:hypothetical protein
VVSRARFLAKKEGLNLSFEFCQAAMMQIDPSYKPIISATHPRVSRKPLVAAPHPDFIRSERTPSKALSAS